MKIIILIIIRLPSGPLSILPVGPFCPPVDPPVLYLCDGVGERDDHGAPHPVQLLLVLHRLGAAPDGAQHRLAKRKRGGGARQAAAHQRLEALEKPAGGKTKSLVMQHLLKLKNM